MWSSRICTICSQMLYCGLALLCVHVHLGRDGGQSRPGQLQGTPSLPDSRGLSCTNSFSHQCPLTLLTRYWVEDYRDARKLNRVETATLTLAVGLQGWSWVGAYVCICIWGLERTVVQRPGTSYPGRRMSHKPVSCLHPEEGTSLEDLMGGGEWGEGCPAQGGGVP